ncbi:MAG: carbon-nitrogen hydrolase family protein [Acidobacteria bacterium]|nr:MAG: carbon-nitrogen hydrolase family protein [Acidobacteriota bacterium]
MKIALVQQKAGPDKKKNVERGLAALQQAAEQGAQLVCYAELAFERFWPQKPAEAGYAASAEPVPGPMTEAFAAQAKALGVVVVLNLFERDGDRCYDCSPVIDADGTLLGRTRMVHITDYPCFHEQGYYTPGDTGAPVYDTAAGRIAVAICYDRHYPEYMRALALARADLVLVPQAGAVGEWPDGLYEAEMRVTAFQNGYWVALCNRVGEEEYVTFAGESFVCDPDGLVTARAGLGEETTLLAEIDCRRAERSHARALFLRDRRPELYAAWMAGR